MVHPRPTERGQAVPLLLVVLVLAVSLSSLLVHLAVAAVERGRAQAAADAAALAGAAGGRGAAAATTEANGAELLSAELGTGRAAVSVAYRRAEATAAAEVRGSLLRVDPVRAGLAPAMLAALARADGLLGRSVRLASGYRSRAEQEELWNHRRLNRDPVAPPSTSMHEVGLAIDVLADEVPALLTVAAEAGLCQPLPQDDPVHFEPCPPIPP